MRCLNILYINNATLLLTSLSFVLFIAVLISIFYIYKYRRKNGRYTDIIREIMKEKEKLNKIIQFKKNLIDLLPKFNEIQLSSSIEELFDNFWNIQKLLGEFLDAEYCTIGLIKNSQIQEKNYWVKKCDSQKNEAFRKVNKHPYDNETLFGSFLHEFERDFLDIPFEWSEKKNDISIKEYAIQQGLSFNSNFFAEYKNILVQQKIHSVIIVPLYEEKNSKKKILGYINLINYRSLTEENLQLIKETAKRLVETIKDFFLYQENLQVRENQELIEQDEKFLLEINKEQNLSVIFERTLKYFAEEFNSAVNSIRVPVVEGFNHNSQNILLHLRNLYCYAENKDISKKIETIIKNKGAIPLNEYIPDFSINNPQDDIFSIRNNDSPCGKELKVIYDKLPQHVIFVPIYVFGENSTKWWENCRAIIIFQPKEMLDSDNLIRIKNIAIQLGFVIEDIVNKKINKHIDKLNEKLQLFNFEDENLFYSNLEKLICNIVECEKCSILVMDNKGKNILVTKENNGNSNTQINNLIIKENPSYSIENKNSVVIQAFRYNKAIIVSQSLQHNECKDFDNCMIKYKTLMVVPLKNSENKIIGVIKCIGKIKNDENLIHVFWERELKLMQLIVSIAMKLIEGFESLKDRKNFIKLTAHELRQPLNSITSDFDILKRIVGRTFLNENQITRFDKDFIFRTFKDCTDELKLINVMLSDLEFLYTDNDIKIKYEKNKQNIVPSIRRIVNLMQSYAVADKNMKIRVHIQEKIPDEILVDKERFEQVLINLLKNAIRYSKVNSEDISIYYNMERKYFDERKNEYWHKFEIVDWGIGFDEEDVIDGKVFRLYQRGVRTRQFDLLGNGIGLYVAQKIIEDGHDGVLRISNIKNPTIVTIYLPKNGNSNEK